MSSLGVGITAAVNAKCLFMLFLIICRQCLFSLPIYCNVCGILSQSVAVVHYEGALKRRVWLVSMCEATMCCEDVWDYHGACKDVCDCGLCVKTVELVRIITAYLQMHLPWFLPNAQTRWLLTTMITHTTRNIAATKY